MHPMIRDLYPSDPAWWPRDRRRGHEPRHHLPADGLRDDAAARELGLGDCGGGL